MPGMQAERLKHIVDVWRRLRRPFELPPGSEAHHKCEWEAIDVDVLGCRICGGIHACDVCTCKEIINTSESVVCAVSGMVLRRHMYSEEEFVDTVAMTGSVSQFDDDIAAEVDTSVQHMLLSASSSRQHRNAFCDLLLRWSRGSTTNNMLVTCAQIMRKAEHYPHVFRFIPTERRRQLVRVAADECRRILRFMINCGMPVKSAEVQRLTVGVLYLMRNGIMRGSEVILHKRMEIAQLLPAENMLYKHYSIHPKFITETENRIKFCLRLKMT